MKRFAILALALAVTGVVVWRLRSASGPSGEAARTAVSQLAKTERFSFGAVSFAGSIPEREDWFFAILASRDSGRLFRELFEQGTMEAKLYALAGLHAVDRSSFNERAARFIREDSRVETQAGCIVSDSTMAEAVAAIERGQFDHYLKSNAHVWSR